MGPSQLVYDRGSASGLTLSSDGHTLAFLSRRTERNQPSHTFLALFDLTTSTLTFPAPSTADDLSPAFSPDGHQLAWLRQPFTAANTAEFATNRTSANPWSIQLLDLTRPITPTRFEGAGSRPRRDAATQQVRALAPEGNPRTVFTAAPNEPGSVLPHMAIGEPRLFWTSTNRLIFPSEADGWLHLYAIDPSSPTSPTLLTPGNFEVEDPTINSTATEFVYAANRRGAVSFAGPPDSNGDIFAAAEREAMDRCHLWQLDLGKHEKPGPVINLIGVDIETHPVFSGDQLAALVSDRQLPMHPVIFGPLGQVASLNSSNTPAAYPASQLVTPQQVLIPSTDNLQIHAQLFLPRQNADSSAALRNDKGRALRNDKQEKHPAILYLHGGPQRQSLLGYPPGEYYSNAYAFNQYLASRGFIVLSVNYRGGTGYGLDFRQCEQCGPTGAAEYADVLAAQRYLASRPDVDPKRIGVWGGSYGGYLTALALARNSDLFAAGVDFHGVHDWNLEDNAADWKRGTNAEQDAIAATALASSPLADISHWTSPILLIHGDNDPDVAYVQTPILADKLRARHTPVEELIFPDETHNFQLHKDWLTAYEAAAAFFERTLKP